MTEQPATCPEPCRPVLALSASIVRGRRGQALVVLDSRPFNGLHISPPDLQHLSQQLAALAALAKLLPMEGEHWAPTRVAVDVVQL